MTQTKVEAPFVANNANFKNLIINGDMQIAQRGTSTTGIGDGDTGFYTCDRCSKASNINIACAICGKSIRFANRYNLHW